MTRKRGDVLPALVVDDFDALDAAIEDFVRDGALAAASQGAYSKRWRLWEAHCEAEGVDPWDAPASAFESLWLRRNEDGTPASFNSIDGIASAVKYAYGLKGLTPAYKLPANSGRWRDLRRSARKAQAALRADQDDEADVVPLLRPELVKMLGVHPPVDLKGRHVKAAVLLAWEGVAPSTLDRLRVGDVEVLDAGAVSVAGTTYECDHRERVSGVPWDCTACSVRDVLAGRPADDQLLPLDRLGWTYWFPRARAVSRHQTPAKEPWGPRGGLTDWELAGLRRALVLSLSFPGWGHMGVRWVRARAWVAMSWSCGLRMSSDTYRLERSALRVLESGGLRLTLGVTKDDPGAAKLVVRTFTESDAVVAQALTEYLCVRDAIVGSDGALIVDLAKRSTAGSPVKAPLHLAKYDLALLADLAGIEPAYSSYSVRKGYAAQALSDGWAPEDVRDGLRHLHLTTTVSHYLPGQDAKAVSQRFVDQLDAHARGAVE